MLAQPKVILLPFPSFQLRPKPPRCSAIPHYNSTVRSTISELADRVRMEEDALYAKKLGEMRGYVPFLEKMIGKLERAGDKSKDPQLAKMKSLHHILTDNTKKLRLDTLEKCEDVLEKLYEKVEGVPLINKDRKGLSPVAEASTPRSPSPKDSQRSREGKGSRWSPKSTPSESGTLSSHPEGMVGEKRHERGRGYGHHFGRRGDLRPFNPRWTNKQGNQPGPWLNEQRSNFSHEDRGGGNRSRFAARPDPWRENQYPYSNQAGFFQGAPEDAVEMFSDGPPQDSQGNRFHVQQFGFHQPHEDRFNRFPVDGSSNNFRDGPGPMFQDNFARRGAHNRFGTARNGILGQGPKESPFFNGELRDSRCAETSRDGPFGKIMNDPRAALPRVGLPGGPRNDVLAPFGRQAEGPRNEFFTGNNGNNRFQEKRYFGNVEDGMSHYSSSHNCDQLGNEFSHQRSSSRVPFDNQFTGSLRANADEQSNRFNSTKDPLLERGLLNGFGESLNANDRSFMLGDNRHHERLRDCFQDNTPERFRNNLAHDGPSNRFIRKEDRVFNPPFQSDQFLKNNEHFRNSSQNLERNEMFEEKSDSKLFQDKKSNSSSESLINSAFLNRHKDVKTPEQAIMDRSHECQSDKWRQNLQGDAKSKHVSQPLIPESPLSPSPPSSSFIANTPMSPEDTPKSPPTSPSEIEKQPVTFDQPKVIPLEKPKMIPLERKLQNSESKRNLLKPSPFALKETKLIENSSPMSEKPADIRSRLKNDLEKFHMLGHKKVSQPIEAKQTRLPSPPTSPPISEASSRIPIVLLPKPIPMTGPQPVFNLPQPTATMRGPRLPTPRPSLESLSFPSASITPTARSQTDAGILPVPLRPQTSCHPSRIVTEASSHFQSRLQFSQQSHQIPSEVVNSSMFARKKPSTYGEYRKLREEQDRYAQEQQKKRDEFRKKFDLPSPAADLNKVYKSEIEESLHSFGSSEDKHATTADSAALSKFKIPKRKRPSVEETLPIVVDQEERVVEPQSSPVISHKESESDSENELKIVLDDLQSEPAQHTSKMLEEKSEKDIEEQTGMEQKQDLSTKKLLQNIVDSLQPEEATKFLKKVNVLEKAEKLSLKQLKFLLDDDSDAESNAVKQDYNGDGEPVTKKVRKGRGRPPAQKSQPLKPIKQQPTLGTRRSRRLNVPGDSLEESTIDDDDDNQLVIDEEEVVKPTVIEEDVKVDVLEDPQQSTSSMAPRSRKRGRGRPPKKGTKRDSIQDASVSSSTQKEDGNGSTDDYEYMSELGRYDVGIKIKEEIDNKEEEEMIPVRTKSGRMRMVPKSKTWFPDRGDSKKGRRGLFKSPEGAENRLIKKEPKDPDPKVFLGSEDIVVENLFETKEAYVAPEVTDSAKSRLSHVNNLFYKLMAVEQNTSKDKVMDKKEIVSTIDLKETSKHDEGLGPFIVTDYPGQYYSNISAMINKLKENIAVIPPEAEDLKNPSVEEVNFLNLVREWRVHNVDTQKIPADKGLELDIYTKLKLSRNQSAATSFKSPEALLEQQSLQKVGHLFKCYAFPCSFTSNDAPNFLTHLCGHSKQENFDEKRGWQRCVYCNTNYVSAESLVQHVVAVHSSCSYQCPYCYHRTGSQVALLIHQQSLHKEMKLGFIRCLSLPLGNDSQLNRLPPLKCKDCKYQTINSEDFAKHLGMHSPISDFTEIICWHCGSSFNKVAPLVLHSILMHTSQAVICGVRHLDLHERNMEFDEDTFSDFDRISSFESSSDEETADVIDEDRIDHTGLVDNPKTSGLIGIKLYRCGNSECEFSAAHASDFRDHIVICEFSVNQIYLTCFHCGKQLKHVPTLLDHLKSHGPKRYYCSLCNYKAALPLNVKNHLKTVHRVLNTKLVPVNPLKNNTNIHDFLMMPKNALSKSSKATSSKTKETFSPTEIDSIPRNSVFRSPLRCSVCDFSTKVRNNLVKHLQLHAKLQLTGTKDVFQVPVLTPINQPCTIVGLHASKMTSLLDADSEEERSKRPMTEEELSALPSLIPDNIRFACCEKDCDYITIDDVMLLYHIQALHPNLDDFACPHCPENTIIPFDSLEFHMRCHGDLLFKCGHCDYYHWQKRTAEKHVADEHPNRKQYTRNVRVETEMRVKMLSEPPPPISEVAKKPKKGKDVMAITYLSPYRCGLCDSAEETLHGIQEHCKNIHGFCKQFKCSFCDMCCDSKTEIEKHFFSTHPSISLSMIRIFFIESSNDTIWEEEMREPLWKRNMPGLKHIRGILFEEEVPLISAVSRKRTNQSLFSHSLELSEEKIQYKDKTVDQADNFPMKCKECGIIKKTIKGLKMHIKLLHLRTGKFLCLRCQFSANILSSVYTHYKIKHPEEGGKPQFEERSDEAKTFSHEFWKAEWDIPTLSERKYIVENRAKETVSDDKERNLEEEPTIFPKGKRRKKIKPGMKRKTECNSLVKAAAAISPDMVETDGITALTAQTNTVSMTSVSNMSLSEQFDKKSMEKIMEISPFENISTFKCQFCPKRSQVQDRMERHLATEHADKLLSSTDGGYKMLTRDQVVDMLTLASTADNGSADYMCFYCDDIVSPIRTLQEHFHESHPNNSFKVKSFQGKGVRGYLECQLCGHLTPGFERSKQKVHFHEEHPLESNVNASKYISKSKTTSDQKKVDFTRFNGMNMWCPKENCTFEAKSLSAMNNHLRRHTQTFKCGHCGKTHTNSSDFHRHSAMLHGDKIPDLIKDPEAEAEFEALKGLFEANLTERQSKGKLERKKQRTAVNTARKSTNMTKSQTARKSTGRRLRLVEEFSFYAMEMVPIDFSQISTRMSMGGVDITLNAQKMAEIINLKPKVFVQDCRKS